MAINAATTVDVTWILAHDTRRWSKQDQMTQKAKRKPLLHSEQQSKVDVSDWARLVAYLILVPGNVLVDFTSRELGQQGDALLAWAALDCNTEVIKEMAIALYQRQWVKAGMVLHHSGAEKADGQAVEGGGSSSTPSAAPHN